MTKPGERTLFDHQHEPTLKKQAGVPFGVALLGLGTIRGFGQKGIQSLVAEFGDELGAVFSLPQEEIQERLATRKINGSLKIAQAITESVSELIEKGTVQLNELEARHIKLVPPSCLPERFRALGTEAPSWLFVQGDATLLNHRPVVAVVGTRKPTELGYRAASVISYVLSSYPVLLVSGLAEGIDGEAHATSLGRCIKNMAFLGHGINLVFPEETAQLRADIIRHGGAVVSEYLPNQNYQKRQFVERNRLQAALADLVIPVEGAAAGGTAHTARFARKYGKTIIGVRWKGANGLVEDLAKEGDRIIEVLTSEGQRELDSLVQKIVSEASQAPYPLAALERQIAREMRGRAYRQEDVARLIEAIQKLSSQELSGNG
jgi:DNA processing protein